MRVISSAIGVERALRRRGWSQAVHALKQIRTDWFVQDCNEFLVCSGHRLYWYKVEARDNPWTLYPFKVYLSGLANLSPASGKACTLRVMRRDKTGSKALARRARKREGQTKQ